MNTNTNTGLNTGANTCINIIILILVLVLVLILILILVLAPILVLLLYRKEMNLLRPFLCTPTLSQHVTVSPHEFAQIACARCIRLNTRPSNVAAQQVLLMPPALGEFVVHLAEVDVLVHGLGLVAFGYALNLSDESVA